MAVSAPQKATVSTPAMTAITPAGNQPIHTPVVGADRTMAAQTNAKVMSAISPPSTLPIIQ